MYEIHIDLYSYVSLFLRTMRCDSGKERRTQLVQLHEVLKLVVLPRTCYHTAIEMHFEWRRSANKVGCEHCCSKCKNEVKDFTKRVDKGGLQSLLADKVVNKDLAIRDFVKVLKKHKSGMFHKEDVPGKDAAGQIHAVCLQLIAAGIVSLKVTDTSKIGTEKITAKDIVVICLNDKKIRDGRVYCRPAMYVDDLWEGFNLCSASNN